MSQRRDARLKTRRERDPLSHRLLPIGGAVIEPTYVLGSITLVNIARFQE
jgi:hypothetical protein